MQLPTFPSLSGKREGVCDDLDLDLEETSDGAQKGRVSRKNKVSERSMKTLNSQLNANLRFPVFDAPGELVNNGPGFDPFSNLGARKDEISYDWVGDFYVLEYYVNDQPG